MIRILFAPTDAAPTTEAAFLSADLCHNCVKQSGLCDWHASHIAALARNGRWIKLMGESYYGKPQADREKDIATQRLLGRKERRKNKRAAELRQLVNDIATPAAA